MKILGSGALNLDLVYEVEDLSIIRKAGFDLSPGREVAGSHEEVKRLRTFLGRTGRLVAESGGGSAANTICALAALGHSCGFAGVVGDDEAGQFILDSMTGVDCSLVRRTGKSAVCVVVIGRKMLDRAMFVAPHEGEAIFGGLALQAAIKESEVLHLSSLVEKSGIRVHERMATMLSDGQLLSLDPGELYARRGLDALVALIKAASILFITREEVAMLTNASTKGDGVSEVARYLGQMVHTDRMRASYPVLSQCRGSLLCMKMGSKGAMALCGGRRIFQSAASVKKIVDNTGAGDAFNAGFLHGMLSGKKIDGCLSDAMGLAALSLSGYGRSWLDRINTGSKV